MSQRGDAESMPNDRTLHEHRVRFRVAADRAEQQVRATADRRKHTITLALPDGSRRTIDVTTARAVCMVLNEAIFTSLEPTGPYLRLESNLSGCWTHGGAGR